MASTSPSSATCPRTWPPASRSTTSSASPTGAGMCGSSTAWTRCAQGSAEQRFEPSGKRRPEIRHPGHEAAGRLRLIHGDEPARRGRRGAVHAHAGALEITAADLAGVDGGGYPLVAALRARQLAHPAAEGEDASGFILDRADHGVAGGLPDLLNPGAFVGRRRLVEVPSQRRVQPPDLGG